MSLNTVVATIYADKPSQLEAIGFNHAAIQSWIPSEGMKRTYPGIEPHYFVTRDFGFEGEGEKDALKWLEKAKTSRGVKRSGLDTDLTYRCDYSPRYA